MYSAAARENGECYMHFTQGVVASVAKTTSSKTVKNREMMTNETTPDGPKGFYNEHGHV